MPQEINLKITGLNTNPSPLGAKEGSLGVASNINIDQPNTATSRRGYGLYSDELTGSKYRAFYNYDGTILAHYGSSIYKDVSGIWTDITGIYDAPNVNIGIRSVQNNGSMFFTTDEGLYKYQDLAIAPAKAGNIKAIGMDLTINSTTGWFEWDNQVAYRILWGIKDANEVLNYGVPSERGEITNALSVGATKTVDLRIYIPDDVTTDHFFQIYRSGLSGGEDIVANDEMQLVYEANPASGDITAGYIDVTDDTPDSLKGETIYTAPTQQGILQANNPPPLANDVCMFRNYAFYANTKTVHRLNITYLGSIANDSTITIGGVVYTAKAAQDHTTGQFLNATAGTVSENIAATAKSLVQVINRYASNTAINAYYISGYDDLPGAITLEARTLEDVSFTAISSEGTKWSPTLTTAQTSDNEEKPNRIYISKQNQVDSVPLLQYIDAGSQDSAILRILPLRESVFAFKDNGEIYRIYGDDINTFNANVFDNTVKLLAPRTATVFNNQIYALTDQGVVSVTNSGVIIKSYDIEDSVKDLFDDSTLAANAYAFSYESDRKYIMSTATQSFVYNSLTNAWTKWDTAFDAAFVNPTNDKIYWGDSDGYAYQERKDFSDTDFADKSYDKVITWYDGTTIYLNNVTNLLEGMTFKQGTRTSQIVSVGADHIVVEDSLAWSVYYPNTPANTAYTSSGTDVFLDSPTNTDFTGLAPMATSGSGAPLEFTIGNNYWILPDEALGTQTYTGDGSGTYGVVKFTPSENIDLFADATFDGLNNFSLDGGASTVQWYFGKSAFTAGFTGDSTQGEIAQNGSIFKGGYTNADLVVRWDGALGAKAGGTAEDTARSATGTGTAYTPIECEMEWLPSYGDNPGMMKRFRQLIIFFRDMNEQFNIEFYNNFKPLTLVSATADPYVVSAKYEGVPFGTGTWGEGNWGGTSDGSQETRTWFPLTTQRCLWAGIRISTERAFTAFTLNAISMMYEMQSEDFRR